jgi:hypothetical protein
MTEAHFAQAVRSTTRHASMLHAAPKLGVLPHLNSPQKGWNNGSNAKTHNLICNLFFSDTSEAEEHWRARSAKWP